MTVLTNQSVTRGIAKSTYNGWSNRETWLAYTWLTNDEFGSELLQTALHRFGPVYEQAQWLCDQYEEALHASLYYDGIFGETGLFSDLIMTAFVRINWTEIVKHG